MKSLIRSNLPSYPSANSSFLKKNYNRSHRNIQTPNNSKHSIGLESKIGIMALILSIASIIVQYQISNAIEKGSTERELQNQEFLKKQDEIQKMHNQLETVKDLKIQALINYSSNCSSILKRAYESDLTNEDLTAVYFELYYQHGVLNQLFSSYQKHPSNEELIEYYSKIQFYNPTPPKFEILNNLEKLILSNIEIMNQEIITIETFILE